MSYLSGFNGGIMSEYLVFYNGEFIGTMEQTGKLKPETDRHLYNGAYILDRFAHDRELKWWRADGTPFPEDQVPAEYRAMALILN